MSNSTVQPDACGPGKTPRERVSAPNLKRRRFLLFSAGGAGAAAAAAVSVTTIAVIAPKVAESPGTSSGYRETEHVRDYYRTARI